LKTVLPRIVKGRDDHIFWGSAVFRLPVEEYIRRVRATEPEQEKEDKLRHVYVLANICRGKFAHFRTSLRLAQVSFFVVVAAEVCRVLLP
jgi:predicted LPLAT superfamily acyltransferase